MGSDKRNYKGNGFAGRNEAWSHTHSSVCVSLSISPSTEPDLDVMVFPISNYSVLSVTFTSSFLSEKYQFPFVPMRIGACVNSVHVPRLIAACLLSAPWSWIAFPPTLSQTFFFLRAGGWVGGGVRAVNNHWITLRKCFKPDDCLNTETSLFILLS